MKDYLLKAKLVPNIDLAERIENYAEQATRKTIRMSASDINYRYEDIFVSFQNKISAVFFRDKTAVANFEEFKQAMKTAQKLLDYGENDFARRERWKKEDRKVKQTALLTIGKVQGISPATIYRRKRSADKARCKQLFTKGMSKRGIAKKLGRALNTIYAWTA